VNLVVFDIDGTLLETSQVDDACFVRAVSDVFGLFDISTDWSQYEHCTDIAIASQLVREQLRRTCSPSDVDALRDRFVKLLEAAHTADAGLFREIVGAGVAMGRCATDGMAVSIATGGFEKSARLKLRLAGLDCTHVPAAFSEDGHSREDIVSAAITRAMELHRNGGFDRIVSIGDGVWDVRAAANLGVPFIGIARGERADRLRAAGAVMVLPDYSDLGLFLTAIEEATAPVPITR
jgi:phosphoglycolate phosphatase-like HAD superfamily hydrolase